LAFEVELAGQAARQTPFKLKVVVPEQAFTHEEAVASMIKLAEQLQTPNTSAVELAGQESQH